MNSNLTFNISVGTGTQTAYPITASGEDMGYFRTSDITGYVDGLEVQTTINPSTPHMIIFTTAPKSGSEVMVRREMPIGKPYANFERGNNFGHRQVNNTFLQQLYLTQELLDGFLPKGFYWKQDIDMGGFNISNVNKVITKEIETDLASIGSLSSDLDMGDHRLLNLPIPRGDKEPIRKGDLSQVSGVAPSFLYVDSKIRTDSASQLGGVYRKDYATGDVIPDDAMKDKLMYWHNGQFYSVGTDTGFTSKDFDADLVVGRFVASTVLTGKTPLLSTGSTTARNLEDRFINSICVEDFGASSKNTDEENTTSIRNALAFAKLHSVPRIDFPRFYFVDDEILVDQIGVNLNFMNSRWNYTGLHMRNPTESKPMLILDAPNVRIGGGFFATAKNQTSIFLKNAGKAILDGVVVKLSEKGVLWEKGNSIDIRDLYCENCVNGLVIQPRGEGDCNGGIITGRSYGHTGVGLDIRRNIQPSGVGSDVMHNTIDFSCEAGAIGIRQRGGHYNKIKSYCEGNTVKNFDTDGSGNIWTIINPNNETDIIKDYASGWYTAGKNTYLKPSFLVGRVQERTLTGSASLIGVGITDYYIDSQTIAFKGLTLGFLAYSPVGFTTKLNILKSECTFGVTPPDGVTLLGGITDVNNTSTTGRIKQYIITKINADTASIVEIA